MKNLVGWSVNSNSLDELVTTLGKIKSRLNLVKKSEDLKNNLYWALINGFVYVKPEDVSVVNKALREQGQYNLPKQMQVEAFSAYGAPRVLEIKCGLFRKIENFAPENIDADISEQTSLETYVTA